MLRRRVIPCLDVANGRVVKGTRFVDLVDEGDPPELAERYAREGADELVFLDISAAPEGRGTLLDIVERTARRAFVPLTVGGGVRSVDEMREVLRAGADKVSLNTRAVADPPLVTACAARFGSQAVVVAIDARRIEADATYPVRVRGRRQGRPRTGGPRRDRLGGTGRRARRRASCSSPRSTATARSPATTPSCCAAITSRVHVPVIASGGASGAAHMVEAIRDGGADAVLAASIFHRREMSIGDVKAELAAAGIPVRLTTGTEVPA